MSLNVNYNLLYKNGIDTSVLKEVSSEILRRASEKNSQYVNSASVQQVNSTPRPAELGIDLYQGKINADVQRQIAINNTLQFQFNESTLNSIKYLNTQAAARNLDGKYMPTVNETITETQKAVETKTASQFMSIFSSQTATDKNGTNPFSFGQLILGQQKKQEEKEDNSLKSIFS